MQPSGAEGGSTVGIGSPQSTDLSCSLPASPNVCMNQEKASSQTPLETCPVSPSSQDNMFACDMEPESLLKTVEIGSRVQGTYTVKSPPLEVVKEESVASVSHLDTLSEQSLLSSNSTVFLTARNDVLISTLMSDSPNQVVSSSRNNESVAVSVALVSTSDSTVSDKLQSSSRTNSTPLKEKEEVRSDLTVNFSLTDINCDRTKASDKRRILNSSVLMEGGAEPGSIKVLNSGTEYVWQDSISPAGIRQRKMATTHAPKLSSLSTDNTVPSSTTGSEVS